MKPSPRHRYLASFAGRTLVAGALVVTTAAAPAAPPNTGPLRRACNEIAAATAMHVSTVAQRGEWGMCVQDSRYAAGQSVWHLTDGRWTFVDGSPDAYRPADAADAHARYAIPTAVFTALVRALGTHPAHPR